MMPRFSFFEELQEDSVEVLIPEKLSFLEKKAAYFEMHETWRDRKRWYKENTDLWDLMKLNRKIRRLQALRLPIYISFLRWMYIDFLRCKTKRFWGIYQFVALPGQGKTLSMVAHMERALETNPDLIIATNFNYKHQSYQINHWSDIITIALEARNSSLPCIIALDEIHVTFDSSDWKSFPQEMLSLLSFNRKFSLQFLCSAQIYERIPKKIRDIANYTVICKNVWGADRLFMNYYFEKNNYEQGFSGKRVSAEFIRDFVADDELYSLYDTLEQVDRMTASAQEEKSKKQAAFELLFGTDEEEPEAPGEHPSGADAAPRNGTATVL